MYTEVFQELGLSKNEAKIYEALIREGESSVSRISVRAEIHRRNVYDSLNRLIAKGLVFEKLQKDENLYKPVDPAKLMELIQEKRDQLKKIMPQLQADYQKLPLENEVYIYKGPAGWENYLRDMLRIGEDAYFIGAKGGCLDERVKDFFPRFIQEAEKKKIKFHHLFDYEVKEQVPEILEYAGKDYKFLPKGYSAPGAIDIFGDHVNILSKLEYGSQPEEIVFTVIVNQQVADSFRTWFKFMWDSAPPVASQELIIKN